MRELQVYLPEEPFARFRLLAFAAPKLAAPVVRARFVALDIVLLRYAEAPGAVVITAFCTRRLVHRRIGKVYLVVAFDSYILFILPSAFLDLVAFVFGHRHISQKASDRGGPYRLRFVNTAL